MHKLIAALAVVSALGFAGSAYAGPIQLSDNQLDVVTAGKISAGGYGSGVAGGSKGSSVLSTGYAYANKYSATAVVGVLAVGVGYHSFAAADVSVGASSSR